MLSLRYRIQRSLVWTRRFFHLGGNGVHSPFAYTFICEVIENTTPYYAYSDLRADLKPLSLRQRKHAKLLFRLANWSQAQTTWLPATMQQYAPLIARGCTRSTIHIYADASELAPIAAAPGASQFIIADLTTLPHELAQATLPEKSVIALFGIRRNTQARQRWQTIIHKQHGIISFDLYDLGLIVSRPTLNKQHYTVNY